MTRGKTILVGAACLVVVIMLFVIFAPSGFKSQKNTLSPTPTPMETWVTNPSITPESMRGEVKATLAAPFKALENSSITGETTFKEINGKVFVGVVLQNADEQIEYPAFIYNGTCAESKDAKYSLSPVSKGRTENYIPKTMSELKKEFPLSVKILKSEAEDSTYLSCADLQ